MRPVFSRRTDWGRRTHERTGVPGHSRPDRRPPRTVAGVVVVHDAFGLGDDMREQADWLAAAGYVAAIPDLYGGKGAVRCIKGAIAQLSAQRGPMFDQLDAARQWLAGQPDCTGRVGVIGYCMGGGFALLLAGRPGWSAASVNYGQVPDNVADVLAGACPLVASYGGEGPRCSAAPPTSCGRALPRRRRRGHQGVSGGPARLPQPLRRRLSPGARAEGGRRRLPPRRRRGREEADPHASSTAICAGGDRLTWRRPRATHGALGEPTVTAATRPRRWQVPRPRSDRVGESSVSVRILRSRSVSRLASARSPVS